MLSQHKIKTLLVVVAYVMPGSALATAPQGVVRAFYRQIVARRPLGIPAGKDREALWPLMTPQLRTTLDVAAECERDYFSKHTCTDCKPTFSWLEEGLFSGSNEEALPAEAQIVKTKSVVQGTYHVTLRFTYRETFATHERPPNPDNHFDWTGMVVVKCRKNRCLIGDFVPVDSDTGKTGTALSSAFSQCSGSRWVDR